MDHGHLISITGKNIIKKSQPNYIILREFDNYDNIISAFVFVNKKHIVKR